MTILDPPIAAPTARRRHNIPRAGGILVAVPCSGGVKDDLFQKIVAGAAEDAQIDAQIIERLFQGPDHPVALNFPEGAYLKGFVIRVAG